MPIVSTHSPADWDYETVGVVTGQSVLGTGVFSDISSNFSDLFGTGSSSLTEKLRAGEKSCYAQIKRQAFETSGNAILALDIDYNEMGGSKAMVMVCMTGTAVLLKSPTAGDTLGTYQTIKERLLNLQNLKQLAKDPSLG